MQLHPYTPGEVARQVPGRELQLAEYEQQLTLMADTRRLIGRIRVEHGARGFGKTSLLRQVQQRAEVRGILTVWVTAGEEVGLFDGIASGIRRAATSWSEKSARSFTRTLDSPTVGIGVPGVAHLDATLRAGQPAGSTSLDLQQLIIASTKHAIGEDKLGLAIFIDEVQAADAAGLRALAYAWQHLQSEEPTLPVAVFAAGLPNSPEAIGKVVTFSERFEYRPLAALSEDAETIALVVPARILGVAWTEDAITRAKQIARGYPYYLQLIGKGSWIAAGNPDQGSEITVSHVDAGRTIMEADMDALFRSRWASATPSQQRFMRAMAELGDGPVQRGEISSAVRNNVRGDISQLRHSLIEKGLIQSAGRGLLEFTVPWFAEFVMNVTDD